MCYLYQHVSWQISDSCVPPQKQKVLLVETELSKTKLYLEIVVISESTAFFYCLNSYYFSCPYCKMRTAEERETRGNMLRVYVLRNNKGLK